MDLEPVIAVTVGPAGLPSATLTPAALPFDLLMLTAETMAPVGDQTSAAVEPTVLAGPDILERDGSALPDPGTVLPVGVNPPVPPDPAATAPASPSPTSAIRRAVATPSPKPRAANALTGIGLVPDIGRLPVALNAMATPEQPLGDRPAAEAQSDAKPSAQPVANPDTMPPLPWRIFAGADTVPTQPATSFAGEPPSPKHVGIWSPEPTHSPGRFDDIHVDDIHVEATSVDHIVDAVRIESSSARLVAALASALPSVGQSLADHGLLVASVSVAVAERSASAPVWDPGRTRRSSSSSFRASPIFRRMRFIAYA